MAINPFLSRVPRKYLIDTEERKFWGSLIQQLEGLRKDAISSESSQGSINDIVFSDYTQQSDQSGDTFEQPIQSTPLESTERNEVGADGITYNAVSGDIVFSFNSAIIYLPDYPAGNDIVSVLSGDNSLTRVRTNTKLINSETEAQFSLAGSYYSFEFSALNDEWRLK